MSTQKLPCQDHSYLVFESWLLTTFYHQTQIQVAGMSHSLFCPMFLFWKKKEKKKTQILYSASLRYFFLKLIRRKSISAQKSLGNKPINITVFYHVSHYWPYKRKSYKRKGRKAILSIENYIIFASCIHILCHLSHQVSLYSYSWWLIKFSLIRGYYWPLIKGS